MAIIPEQYKNAVISIGEIVDEKTVWFGTGFLVVKKISESDYLSFMVTNKHVLKDKDSIVIRLRKKESKNLEMVNVMLLENEEKNYSVHPDPQIDIAVMFLHGSFLKQHSLVIDAFDIDEQALTSSEFFKEGGCEGTSIYMLGYPMGMANVDSNHPICRAGCIARAYEEEIKKTKNVLLDIQNFPGNSGSPVINRPELMSLEGSKALNKTRLIGIVHSYIPYTENLINMQTKAIVEIRSENSGLANCHPVELIKDVIDIEIKRVSMENKIVL